MEGVIPILGLSPAGHATHLAFSRCTSTCYEATPRIPLQSPCCYFPFLKNVPAGTSTNGLAQKGGLTKSEARFSAMSVVRAPAFARPSAGRSRHTNQNIGHILYGTRFVRCGWSVARYRWSSHKSSFSGICIWDQESRTKTRSLGASHPASHCLVGSSRPPAGSPPRRDV